MHHKVLRRISASTLTVLTTFALVSCGGSDESAGDQDAAAELYIEIYSPSDPDCVRSEHKKVDNDTASNLLEAYKAYEANDYEKEDAAYAAIGEETMTELTVALNKCAMG